MINKSHGKHLLAMYNLSEHDLNLILYWITGCEDLQRPKKCQECIIYKECSELRYKLWERDVLKDTKYRMNLNRVLDDKRCIID